MDILYIIGRGSRHDNIELRWSLRSLAKFGKGIGRVVVAGYPPSFLSDEVYKVPVADLSDDYKHHNILAAILAAFDATGSDGQAVLGQEVLYSSDDHFLVAPVDFDNYPFYFKAERLPSSDDFYGVAPTPYQKSLIRTRQLLEAAGMEPRNWSGHRNTHLSRIDVPRVRELIELGKRLGLSRFGYEPTCLFMAARAARETVVPTFLKDVKIGGSEGVDSDAAAKLFSGVAQSVIAQISISDAAFSNPDFLSLMRRSFSSRCNYEKEPA